MIASLTGTITYKSPELRKDSYLVIQAGGVGYKVFTPVSNLRQVIEGQSAVLYTYLAVSENPAVGGTGDRSEIRHRCFGKNYHAGSPAGNS